MLDSTVFTLLERDSITTSPCFLSEEFEREGVRGRFAGDIAIEPA